MKDSTQEKEATKDSVQQVFDEIFISFYQEAINKAIHIQKLKNETYNGNKISYEDYTKIPEMYPALLYGKVLRMVSIMQGSKNNFESMEDTLIDMINYAAFTYATFKMKDLDD